jgi:S-adenosylmethionine:tRNA ribosyltransferase-isomerase
LFLTRLPYFLLQPKINAVLPMHPSELRITDYTYQLPDCKIAQHPLNERDSSKLLVYNAIQDSLNESKFLNLNLHIPTGSLLIFNETKVIHARLVFKKATGGQIEIFCLSPYSPVKEVNMAFRQKSPVVWKAYIGNAKRWKSGTINLSYANKGKAGILEATLVERLTEGFLVSFSWADPELDFGEILNLAGNVPLPPYIQRKSDEKDENSYQTIYAKNNGSVAAPTAGLHFTEDVFDKLREKNIATCAVTLHVGAGTFKPVESDTLAGHAMHTEEVSVSLVTLEQLLVNYAQPRIVVGTTTLRTLESVYWAGVKLINGEKESYTSINQWMPYDTTYTNPVSAEASLQALITHLKTNDLSEFHGFTSLLIAPGYRFRMADALITNFHQPGSTLLLLVSAFIGHNWQKVYQYALANNFRFLSYGDACLFINSSKCS